MDLHDNEIILRTFAKLDRLLDRYVPSATRDADFDASQAYVWNGERKALSAVARPVRIDPAQLIGIDRQKQELLLNTRRFLDIGGGNNVLLWGERGTGKSSLVKSLLSAFAGTPLRIVQVLKHDILTIQYFYEIAVHHSAHRFILFIDDLSFEEGQMDYKEMKTIMDGGLEQIPDNILFYATSNRKHLIPTRFSDNDDVVRPSDTIEEKVSLADRFGLRLGFYHFDQETYFAIVDLYARKAGIRTPPVTLHQDAVRWALEAGSRNGRTAEQFVRSLQES